MFKIIIVIVLLAILASLGMGLFGIMGNREGSNRTVKALTLRIALSLALFLFLLLGFATGLISPHGLQ